ncbi:NAD(P)-dependent oxidoreductase [Olivibacter domesticus]|uniref:Putative NADH-flavin reductase n=1 Tax=Olivibacter domesticus TaxID=407022 RepID=A0A1H7JHS5_OLID1|nr:NAD(P)H-binding protein [Olivibacter domesticus]SEK74179.1 Putative NADH-flavin reductase [Olivibacter domesticus]
MEQNIKIAVIGGTGKSGKYLVKYLLNQHFSIKVLLRNPHNLTLKNPLIESVNGNVADYDAVFNLVNGCQAVISTLGLGNPASEPTIFSLSTSNILRAMTECGVRRYIVTTGLNVDTPFDRKSPKVLAATDWMKNTYPLSTINKQLEYELLSKSNIDWTLVRLPMIEQTDKRMQIRVSLTDCPGEKVSATDLACFLNEQLTDNQYVRKSPFIASV